MIIFINTFKAILKKNNPLNIKVAIVGAGYIGSVLAAVLAENGAEVIALDINENIVEKINLGKSPVEEPGLEDLIFKNVKVGRLKASNDISQISKADVILLTVGTPLSDNGSINKEALRNAIKSIAPFVVDDQLVIVKSTVSPYSTENEVAKPLRKKANVFVSFCPERLSEGNAINDCKTIPVVVGGVDEESSNRSLEFWKRYLRVDCILLENARAAELVKLADNTWIDLNIALAFELAKIADKLDVDVLPIIKAANSLPKGASNVNILLPSVGVGGYCLTKDPWFLYKFAKDLGEDFNTAKTSRIVNDQMPNYSFDRILHTIQTNFSYIKPQELKICILGLSFKSNTGDCRFTPTISLINDLINNGYKVVAYDKFVSDEDFKAFKNVIRAHKIDEALKNAQVVAFLTGHDEFKLIEITKLKNLLKPNAFIYDGRMYFSNESINEFKDANFIFKGVGR